MEGPRTGAGAPPTQLQNDARDPIWAAGADWWPCLRDPGLRDVVPVSGTRDHLHVTGKETEPDLLRPASCDPRL